MDWVRVLCKRESGSRLYKCSAGPDFKNIGLNWCSSGRDYINQSPGVKPDLFGPAPDFISFSVQDPGPDFIKKVLVRVWVRILFNSSPVWVRIFSSKSGSGFYHHPY